MLRVTTLACVFLVAAVACGKSTGPATEVKDTFNHACRADEDCAIVFIGPTCGFCGGSNTAIAKSDQAKHQKAYNEARDHCPPSHEVGDCEAAYAVSQCSAAKTCAYIRCDAAPKDEHHCR